MNDEEQKQADIAKHAALISARDVFVTKFTAALKAAGLTVEANMPTEMWTSGVLTITSDQTKEFEHYARFEIRSMNRWSRSTPDKLRLTYATAGRVYRGEKTHYTKLDDALIEKLVGVATQGVKNALKWAASRVTQKNLEAHYAVVKKEQLAGVVVPPGTEIKIVVSDNDTYAGRYYVSFERSESITSIPLNAEQVKKLLAVLNEIQDTANGYIIAGTHPLNNTPVVNGIYGMHSSTDPKMYPSKEAALADIPHVSEQFTNRDSLRVLPYADYAKI